MVILDPATGSIRQRVQLPSAANGDRASEPGSSRILQPDKKGQVSYTGLKFSPDGRRLFLSSVNGSVKVFSVEKGEVAGKASFSLPAATAPHQKTEIPAGLAVSADGKRLYVTFSLSNRLAEMDAETGQVLRTWEVGMVPYDVVLAGGKAFVSNW